MPNLVRKAKCVTSAIIAVIVEKPQSSTRMGNFLKVLNYHIRCVECVAQNDTH